MGERREREKGSERTSSILSTRASSRALSVSGSAYSQKMSVRNLHRHAESASSPSRRAGHGCETLSRTHLAPSLGRARCSSRTSSHVRAVHTISSARDTLRTSRQCQRAALGGSTCVRRAYRAGTSASGVRRAGGRRARGKEGGRDEGEERGGKEGKARKRARRGAGSEVMRSRSAGGKCARSASVRGSSGAGGGGGVVGRDEVGSGAEGREEGTSLTSWPGKTRFWR